MRRLFAVLFWPLLIVWSAWLLSSTTTYAQAADDGQRAYTVEDPVRPGGIGLATRDGRFAVSLADRCAYVDIGPGMNVELWRYQDFSGIGTIAPVDDNGVWDQDRWCGVRFEQLADPTPCFMNAEGACDVALELEGY